jgi:GNAT superfamily N-acetyltransferase
MFILPSHRGNGLGRWLVECMMEHPDIMGLCRILLNTCKAHDLYKKCAGFRTLLSPESWLECSNESPLLNAGPVVQSRSKSLSEYTLPV